MGKQIHQLSSSWLALVAETAGVSGATVARVEICGEPALAAQRGNARAVVQILDDHGHVIGAAVWEGENSELARGVQIDVGCDLAAAWASRVVGWIEPSRRRAPYPERAMAPWDAAGRYFEPGRAMKLMLRRTEPAAFTSSDAAPMEAA